MSGDNGIFTPTESATSTPTESVTSTPIESVTSETAQENGDSEETTTKTRKKANVLFPSYSLKESLRIAQSIEDNHAGQPFNILDLAESLGYSPGTTKFRQLITFSYRHGLTNGSYNSKSISLTDLGRAIVEPRDDQERNDGIAKALFNIPLYKSFINTYDRKKLPADENLKNILVRDYGVPPEDVALCMKVLKQNLEDWNLIVEISGSKWIGLEKLSSKTALLTNTPEEQKITDNQSSQNGQTTLENVGLKDTQNVTPITNQKDENVVQKPDETKQQNTAACAPSVPKVFIAHSKNKEILEHIKQILKYGGLSSIVAEETETTAIPVPDKIFGHMKECNCAIINISADENEKDAKGNYRVNGNVLIEIGAAYALYDKKIILLTDIRVKELPSNLQGVYKCEYEGNELSGKTTLKLLEALSKFKDNA